MEITPSLLQAGGRESLPSVGGAVSRLRQCGLCRFVVWLPHSVSLNGLFGEPFQPKVSLPLYAKSIQNPVPGENQIFVFFIVSKKLFLDKLKPYSMSMYSAHNGHVFMFGILFASYFL